LTLAAAYPWDFAALRPFEADFVHGLFITLYLSLITIAISFILAVPGVVLRISPNRAARGIMRAYVDIVRNMPTLVILYAIYFGLGHVFTSFISAVIALSVSGLAFTIEAYRGGIQGVAAGQEEAAKALNLHGWRMWRFVILPQAIRIAFPALGNLVISIVLSTSLVLVVGTQDITFQANAVGALTFRYFEAFVVAAIIYVVLSMLITFIWRILGRILFPDYRL
jgi:His/Glu/Gln/Arg/opine family amino acid ABC transporter permease subunit